MGYPIGEEPNAEATLAPTFSLGRIERIDTYRWKRQPHALFVEVRTESGLVGTGESFGRPEAMEASIHDFAAPIIAANGCDASQRKLIWDQQFAVANIHGYAGA